MIKKIKAILLKNKYMRLLITNYEFRTVFFSVFSLLFGIAYAVLCFIVGTIRNSLWFFSLACYYLVLDAMRGIVLVKSYKHRKDFSKHAELYDKEKVKNCFICGILLLSITAALSAMIVHIVRKNVTYEYPNEIIYIIAGYTFLRIGISTYNFFKSRKQNDYDVKVLRCINLSTALVSFLSLQSAALTAFSKNVNQTVANAITGVVVCILIVAIGVYMIIDSLSESKRRKNVTVSRQN